MEGTIGQYLSDCRREKGLSLEQLSEKTHIKLRILKQLENNDFDDLGGTGYVKGFILSYARAVGANEPKILMMFGNIHKENNVQYKKISKTQPKKVLIPTSFFSIIFLIILIAVLTFVTIRLYNSGQLSSPNLQKITDTINLKKLFQSKDSEDTEEKEENEIIIKEPQEKSEINEEAIHDTTDYTKELIFEGKENPFNEE